MKIWQSIPLFSSTYRSAVDDIDLDTAAYGVAFTWEMPYFTRLRKIHKAILELDKRLSTSLAKKGPPSALWLMGNGTHAHSFIETWSSSSIHSESLMLFIRNVIDADENISDDIDNRLVDELTSRIFLCVGPKYDPHKYEKLFYSASRKGYAGITFDIEHATRAGITLAHRFDLEVIVTGVVHQRHEKIALKSGADQFIVS